MNVDTELVLKELAVQLSDANVEVAILRVALAQVKAELEEARAGSDD